MICVNKSFLQKPRMPRDLSWRSQGVRDQGKDPEALCREERGVSCLLLRLDLHQCPGVEGIPGVQCERFEAIQFELSQAQGP